MNRTFAVFQPNTKRALKWTIRGVGWGWLDKFYYRHFLGLARLEWNESNLSLDFRWLVYRLFSSLSKIRVPLWSLNKFPAFFLFHTRVLQTLKRKWRVREQAKFPSVPENFSCHFNSAISTKR